MFRGVAPTVLLAQVRNTAAWALDGPEASWRRALAHAEATAQDYDDSWAYLRLLLAAHFATVATCVPTDVDSHIRHHAWQRAAGPEALRAAVAVLDETDAWDAREVSARVVAVPGVGELSGHDGEWMAVRAGALGRALALGDDLTVERLAARLDAAVARHAKAVTATFDAKGRELDALRVATTVAHNLGDLSRVVEEWPARTPAAAALARRYARLGREEGATPLALAGRVNKAVTAAENHRFLALRAARPLRLGRALLLPLGPFFDRWGESVATSPLLAPDTEGHALGGRAAVVAALVEAHLAGPSQQGVLRALAGFHRAHPGGLDAVAGDVPARLRKHLRAGPVREALGVDRGHFEARMARRFTSARDGRP